MLGLRSPAASTTAMYESIDGTARSHGVNNVPFWRRKSTRLTLGVLLSSAALVLSFTTSGNVQDVAGSLASAASSQIASFTGNGSNSTSTNSARPGSSSGYEDAFDGHTTPYSPSADLMPPALSQLPSAFRRVTLINIWSSDNRPSYMNNFFRSAALNADVMDLLVVHISSDRSKCLDGNNEFSKTDGIERDGPAWNWKNGGNIRIVCMSREKALQMKRDYLCSDAGWKCNVHQRNKVLDRLHERPDPINNEFKPLHGQLYREYFIHPENPLWGWVDTDVHLGRLSHIPFSLLAQYSMVGIHPYSPSLLLIMGQLAFFNLASPGFERSWLDYAPLATPEAFFARLAPENGGFAEGGTDETWLSAAWLRQSEGYAGRNLSWAHISDVHGQDVFVPGRKFVVSGRDILEVDAELTRHEIEAVLDDASLQRPDEYAGFSDSGYTVRTPMHLGKVCKPWFPEQAAQCVEKHELSVGDQFTRIDSVRRPTVIRLPEDAPNTLRIRLEPDRRPRRWQRKLMIHYQEIKRQTWWWELPPWFIGDNDEVMEFDWKVMNIWRKGSSREETLWHRENDRLDENGVSLHTVGHEQTQAGYEQHTAEEAGSDDRRAGKAEPLQSASKRSPLPDDKVITKRSMDPKRRSGIENSSTVRRVHRIKIRQ